MEEFIENVFQKENGGKKMYTYSKLKEALYKGKSVNSPDWTPNDIKALVITRYYIVIAYHVGNPRCVNLNCAEVEADISRNGTNGSLHNLLSQRQLSCLEEIYVDSVFKQYSGFMNLESYVNGLVNTASRLRYYGYIDPSQEPDVQEKYAVASIQGISDYTYALDKSRVCSLEYLSTNNNDWFCKYNLRPDVYKRDADKGALQTYFKMVENTMKKAKAKEMEALKEQGIDSAIKALYKQDLDYAEDIIAFLKLRQWLSTCSVDTLANQVKSLLKAEYKSEVKSVNPTDLQKYIHLNNAQGKVIINAYKTFGVIKKEDSNLDLEELVERAKAFKGLIGLPDVLLKILLKLVKSTTNKLNDAQRMLFILINSEGSNVSILGIENYLKEQRSSFGCVRLYMDLLMGLCGCTRQDI